MWFKIPKSFNMRNSLIEYNISKYMKVNLLKSQHNDQRIELQSIIVDSRPPPWDLELVVPAFHYLPKLGWLE